MPKKLIVKWHSHNPTLNSMINEIKTQKRDPTSTECDEQHPRVLTRCAPRFLHRLFTGEKDKPGIKSLMQDIHHDELRKTPFYHFIDIPDMLISSTFLVSVLRRWDVEVAGVELGGRFLKLSKTEFSVILGLPAGGKYVDFDTKSKSSIHTEADRKDLEISIRQLVLRTDEEGLAKFRRSYILLIFVTLLFPTTTFRCPKEVLVYADNLDEVGLYDWGRAAHEWLLTHIAEPKAQIQRPETVQLYVQGCTIALLVWLYEHVPSIVGATDMTAYPRLCRWGGGYLPRTVEAADKMLDKLEKKHVEKNLFITERERALLEQQHSAMLLGPEQRSKHREDRHSLDIKDVLLELRHVQQKVAVLTARINVLEGKKENKEDDDDVDNNIDFVDDSDDDKDADENDNDRDKDDTDKQDEDGIVIVWNEEDLAKEYDKDREQIDDMNVVKDIQREDDAKGNMDEKNEVNLGDGSKVIVQALLASGNRLSRKLKLSSQNLVGRAKQGRKAKHQIRRRGMPSKKRKLKNSKTINVDDIFMGSGSRRVSFQTLDPTLCKRVMTAADDDDAAAIRWIIDQPITSDELWREKHYDRSIVMAMSSIKSLLEDKEINVEVINVFLRMIQVESHSVCTALPARICLLRTQIMATWLTHVRTSEGRELSVKEWTYVKEQSQHIVQYWLEDLEPVISQSRYLFVPLNYRNHWHLLVVDIAEKKMMHYDPGFVRTEAYKRRAVQAGSCIKYWLAEVKIDMSSTVVENVEDAPMQGADLDCGVFVCYYCESLAMTHSHSWREEPNMKWMRARIAGSILRDENCLTLGRMTAAISVDNLLMD